MTYDNVNHLHRLAMIYGPRVPKKGVEYYRACETHDRGRIVVCLVYKDYCRLQVYDHYALGQPLWQTDLERTLDRAEGLTLAISPYGTYLAIGQPTVKKGTVRVYRKESTTTWRSTHCVHVALGRYGHYLTLSESRLMVGTSDSSQYDDFILH